VLWISRVPENITEARDLLELKDENIAWLQGSNGYSYAEVGSSYGGIKQRWIIISSEQAYKREKITFANKLEKLEEKARNCSWHLSNEVFNCKEDAIDALNKLQNQHKFFIFDHQIKILDKYTSKGRPKSDSEKTTVGYQLAITVNRNQSAIEKELTRKGRFILASNDIVNSNLTPLDILTQYKDQQDAEGGFRFLKDPWFMVSSFFVKKASRIAALMMVMTLSLLVYNFAQYELRKALKEQDETIPNQLGKEIKNPTLRWIFQIMEGIGIVKIYNQMENLMSSAITNLSKLRLKIIRMFGQKVCNMYGINLN
jgi:transposase